MLFIIVNGKTSGLETGEYVTSLVAFYQVNVPNFPATDWAAIQRERLTGTASTGIAVIAGMLYQCDPILYMSLSGSATVLH